ncbi:MAG: hypothetical protein VCD50_03085 [Alphaproteobacteria bacterium]
MDTIIVPAILGILGIGTALLITPIFPLATAFNKFNHQQTPGG